MHFSTLLAACVAGAATVAATREVLVYNGIGCDIDNSGETSTPVLLGEGCTNFGQPGVLSMLVEPATISKCEFFGSPDCQNKCVGAPTQFTTQNETFLDCFDLTCIAASVSCSTAFSSIVLPSHTRTRGVQSSTFV
jgi:hypothetical protein